MFSDITKQFQLLNKRLILDCCTRWNATYAMLSCALEFKQVFPRYQQRDPNYKHLPSEDDWFGVKEVCSFLGLFNEVTNIISGNKCLIFYISIHFYFYFLQLCYTIQIFVHSNKFRFWISNIKFISSWALEYQRIVGWKISMWSTMDEWHGQENAKKVW